MTDRPVASSLPVARGSDTMWMPCSDIVTRVAVGICNIQQRVALQRNCSVSRCHAFCSPGR
jgi:hypothetical protein